MNRLKMRLSRLRQRLVDSSTSLIPSEPVDLTPLKDGASFAFEKGLSPFLLKICTYLDQF